MTNISSSLNSGFGDEAVPGVYLFRGTPVRRNIGEVALGSYHTPQFEADIEKERRRGDAINRILALVSHSHGRAHTPALTPPYSPDQSGQGRPTVNLSGAPMTTHRNNNAQPSALRLPVTGTVTQRVRRHAQSTTVGPSTPLGSRA